VHRQECLCHTIPEVHSSPWTNALTNPMKSYLELIKIDIKLALRQRTVIFFNYLFPLVFFFAMSSATGARQSAGNATYVMNMSLTLGVLGSGLFGAGVRAIQERELNILRRYKVTPITPGPLLVASMVTGWVIFMPSIVLLLAFSVFWNHMPWPEHLISLLCFVSLALVAFRSMGLVISSVANTMQEGTILVQLLYFPMLLLSGATIPASRFGPTMQIVSGFIPSTYMVKGVQGMLLKNEGLFRHGLEAGALVITAIVGWLVSMKLFRWEKEEKIKGSAKLWVGVVLAPFLVMGIWQAYTKENARTNKLLDRQIARRGTILITGARIIVGDGKVIEYGAVLVRNGKIAEVYDNPPGDTRSLNAEVIEAAGKTVVPGLIDMHVHLGAPGGLFQDPQNYQRTTTNVQQHLAAYLYSGVTAVKSVGDELDLSLKTRAMINSGEILGAELFVCGPLFTTEGGHGTEYGKYMPPSMQAQFNAQYTRLPKTAAEAKQQVDELKGRGVDGIKAILEAGRPGALFNRMDPAILKAIAEAARADKLPITVHTGESRDVADALAAEVNGIEHGSARDAIPQPLFAQMAKNGVFYDPTLSVFEAAGDFSQGKDDLLKRSLVQQVIQRDLLRGTQQALAARAKTEQGRPSHLEWGLPTAQANLLQAYQNHVPLVTGSDAGNMLVVHGPTVQHELELWVKAGIPPEVALQAATYNAARFLGADHRIGTVRKGNDADLLIVEGNPLQDISALERISRVIFKGEVINRPELMGQE
jgi:imidazolonepropionase-like amidohydrolase/ABC-type multidrug transport system permease subunit